MESAIIALQVILSLGIIIHILLMIRALRILERWPISTVTYSHKTVKKEPTLADCDNILKRKPKYKTDVGWYDWEKQRDREQNR